MTISNDVFSLIKSLNRKEYLYILKKFEAASGEETQYHALFTAMVEQIEYDEEAIKKLLFYKKTDVAFSSLKNYLYEFIIDKLIYVNRHSNRILNSNTTLQELNILYNKELFSSFYKRWQKANVVAHEFEDYAMILALKEQLNNLRIRQIIKTDEEDFKKIQKEEVYIIEHFGKLQLLKSLYNRIILLASKADIIFINQDLEILKEIKENDIFNHPPEKISSFRYIYYFYICQGLIAQLEGRFQDSYNFLFTLKPYIETKANLLSTKPLMIYDYVEAMYPVCMYLKHYDTFFSLFKIAYIKKTYLQEENSYLNIFQIYALLRFGHRTLDFSLADKCRTKLVKILKKPNSIKHVHLERNIICSISISFFVFGQYEEAYFWGKKYFDIGTKYKKADQFDFFHLFIVLICFELKQFTIFNSVLNNSYQYFYRKKKLGPLESSILNSLRKVPSTFFKTERKKMYATLENALSKFTEEEKKVNGFRFFNFYNWTCSKLNEVSYIDYQLQQAKNV